jgi:hypothetical protein
VPSNAREVGSGTRVDEAVTSTEIEKASTVKDVAHAGVASDAIAAKMHAVAERHSRD